jgi:hypothetical protein
VLKLKKENNHGKKAIQNRIEKVARYDDQLDIYPQGDLSARADLQRQRRAG